MKDNDKGREELTEKLGAAFHSEISELPLEMQKILIDDLVTAFESRLQVFLKLSG